MLLARLTAMDTENQVPSGGGDQSLKAKAKEAVGWATGDRSVEAEGKAETEEAEVEEVTEQVREDHGDIAEP